MHIYEQIIILINKIEHIKDGKSVVKESFMPIFIFYYLFFGRMEYLERIGNIIIKKFPWLIKFDIILKPCTFFIKKLHQEKY